MPKSILTKEIKEKIYDLLSSGQTIEYVCNEINITKPTFFNWQKRYPDFAEMVEKAKQEYKKNCPDEIKQIASNKINDLIKNGHVVRVTRKNSTTNTRRYPVYENNQIKEWRIRFEDTIETIDTTETNFGTPQFAFERVLEPNLEQAFKVIQSYGYAIIIDPDQIKSHQELIQLQAESQGDQDNNKGLTEQTANEIRARILGISEDATDTVTVPTEMGEG
jgi:hypothetical protein